MARILITLCVVSICISCLIGCASCGIGGVPTDNQLIETEFGRWSPGYSSIEILDRKGDGTADNPRILTIQATINSYPDSVVCEGELVFFHSDPSYLDMRWYTLEGVGHALLVQWASQSLKDSFPQREPVSLVLKCWVDNGLIELDDIVDEFVRQQVESWIENPASQPNYNYNAGLFDTNQIRTFDLAPELSDDQKVPIYILLSDDDIVEMYLVDKAKYYEYKMGKELPWGTRLSNPIPRPVKESS